MPTIEATSTVSILQGGMDLEVSEAELDGTFLKAQRERVSDFEVRLGVLYGGKKVEDATAKHSRIMFSL